MEAPDEAAIDAVKAKHPTRSLHLVEMVDGDDVYSFLMTGPNREEYRKYMQEMSTADKDIDKLRSALERAALAQVRWPDREEVQRIFDLKPGLVMNFGEELAKASGSSVEVRTKKL